MAAISLASGARRLGALLVGTSLVAALSVPMADAAEPDRPAPPRIDARSWLIADMDSGDVLAAREPHRRFSPASTQKMLTAVTLLPRLDPDGRYRARPADAMVEGTAAGLRPGRFYSHDDLFHALFLPSANDAANALARANGGLDETVEQMNETARELGATDTVAANPSGLEPDNGEPQFSSAYDLCLIARAGMRRADFADYVKRQYYEFPSGKSHYTIQNTNRLLGNYRGMLGVKTGYTSKALNTHVAAAERKGVRILVAALGMPSDPTTKMRTLLNWGFAHRDSVEPVGHLVTPEEAARQQKSYPPLFAILS